MMQDVPITGRRAGLWAAAAMLAAMIHFGVPAAELSAEGIPAPSVSAVPKVIYGNDDRVDVYLDPRTDHRVWAASTCGLIRTERMIKNADGSWKLMPRPYLQFGLPACPEEPFGDQPTGPFCTGFLVGPDLVVTAGHCLNDPIGFSTINFVFGYQMLDASTARLNFPAENVYQGVELISAVGAGPLDHSIIRLDRPVTAPGARPFHIRREGVIAVGERVGIIGHPSGLPLKIAFGEGTAVRTSSDPSYFVANTDSYGGNSGSPVINQATGLVEGILVRGFTDYINKGTCFVSNVISNTAGTGESCTRLTSFLGDIPALPSSSGTLSLSRDRYSCDDTMLISVADSDLAGLGMTSVTIDTSSGDHEAVALTEQAGQAGQFSVAMPVAGGAPVSGNGFVDVQHGDLITVTYLDAADGEGHTVEVTATALADCMPPVISGVSVVSASDTEAVIHFDTDEVATGRVDFGIACGNPQHSVSGGPATGHDITLTGLTSQSTYQFSVSATDTAGNQKTDNNGGACYSFTTGRVGGSYTEWFVTNRPLDLSYRSLTFAPQTDPSKYRMCIDQVAHLPSDTAGAQPLTLGDDDFAQVDLVEGAKVRLFGQEYERVFVGSNGYLTFTSGDSGNFPTAANHFSQPRVSALFGDLAPSVRGAVLVQQLSDRFTATFDGVPFFSSEGAYPAQNSNTFQVELFFDGTIRITWQGLYPQQCIVGLSPGTGVPADYESDDFSTLPSCSILDPNGGVPYSADVNGDQVISLSELLRVVQMFNSDGYSCDAAGEDGYRPGPGPEACKPHDTDYNPQDWRIELSELLRVVQMFNAGGYVFDPHTEDGFRPKSNAD